MRVFLYGIIGSIIAAILYGALSIASGHLLLLTHPFLFIGWDEFADSCAIGLFLGVAAGFTHEYVRSKKQGKRLAPVIGIGLAGAIAAIVVLLITLRFTIGPIMDYIAFHCKEAVKGAFVP